MERGDATLSLAELVQITGYKRPADQVRELQRQGFYRARRSPTTGETILERVHYEAICAGQRARAPRPQLKSAKLRLVRPVA